MVVKRKQIIQQSLIKKRTVYMFWKKWNYNKIEFAMAKLDKCI